MLYFSVSKRGGVKMLKISFNKDGRFEIIKSGLLKVKEYKEGPITYICQRCNHVINKPKNVENKDFKCIYCGELL